MRERTRTFRESASVGSSRRDGAAWHGHVGHGERSLPLLHGIDRHGSLSIVDTARLLGDRLQVLRTVRLAHVGALAARDGRVARGRDEQRLAHVHRTLLRIDDLELEAAALRLVLDERDRFRVAFAHDGQVVHFEYEIFDAQARVERRRVRLHGRDLVRAAFVGAHREAEAVVVGTREDRADACTRN